MVFVNIVATKLIKVLTGAYTPKEMTIEIKSTRNI